MGTIKLQADGHPVAITQDQIAVAVMLNNRAIERILDAAGVPRSVMDDVRDRHEVVEMLVGLRAGAEDEAAA